MVRQRGIGSGPGTARRARAPTMNPLTAARRTKVRTSMPLHGLARGGELATQRLDLVAQVLGVLEAQVLGRREHLLLERDQELVELVGGQALQLVLTATTAARCGRRLGR